MIRLDKLLSSRGYCSRSGVKKLIKDGRILISGEPAKKSDQKVNPEEVQFDGENLDPGTGLILMLYKPSGLICSRDEPGSLVYEILPERFNSRNPKLVCVGRLDKDSSGLLLFTDDGDLVHKFTSPKHAIKKVYEVTLRDPLKGNEEEVFSSGTLMLRSEETPLMPAEMEIVDSKKVILTITEGRYHQIRRMFAALENEVLELKRIKIGTLTLDGLEEGEWRVVERSEIESLI